MPAGLAPCLRAGAGRTGRQGAFPGADHPQHRQVSVNYNAALHTYCEISAPEAVTVTGRRNPIWTRLTRNESATGRADRHRYGWITYRQPDAVGQRVGW